MFAALLIHERGVFFVNRIIVRPHRFLQRVDCLGVEKVFLPVFAPLVFPARIQSGIHVTVRGKSPLVAAQELGSDHIQIRSLDTRRGPAKIFFDDRVVEPDRLEDLCPAVALDRRDPHLGHRLDDAFDRRLEEVFDGGFVVEPGEHPLPDHVIERLEGQIRVDGAGAVADEKGEVMDLARFAGFDHQAHFRACPFADQVVVQARNGQQSRNGDMGAVHTAITEDENILPRSDGGVRRHAELVHRGSEPIVPFGRIKKQRKRDRMEPVALDMADLFEFGVGDNRAVELDHPATHRRGIEQVPLGSQHRHRGGDNFFADRVDRRVGDLREELLEIIVEEDRAVREHGQRSVGSHGTQRLHAIPRHRAEDDPLVLESIAERLLALEDRVVLGQELVRRFRQAGKEDVVFFEPLPVGMLACDAVLDLLVSNDPAFAGVHEKHATRLETAFLLDPLRRDGQDSRLRSHDDQAVFGDPVARGTQAVAVEHGPDDRAVGKCDGSGTVPWLHQTGMEFVKRALVVGHCLVEFPWLGNHHHHRMRQRAPRKSEELQTVVEHRGVRSVGVDHGKGFRKILAEQRAGKQGLTRVHPIDIAAQRVDLAVVGDVPVGMRAVPTRESIRREPGMHERERRFDVRVFQVREIGVNLLGHEHAFVNNRPAGKRGHKPHRVDARRPDRVRGALADNVELALESHRIRAAGLALDEDLPHARLAGAGGRAER